MWRKFVLYLIHENKICKNTCSKNYPWGWKSKDIISDYKKLLINKKYKNIKSKESIIEKNINEFNEKKFLDDSIFAYNVIYKAYLNNEDFLDHQYTNPRLSIALNELRRNTCENLIVKLPEKIEVNNSVLLSNKIKNEVTTNNFKLFGFYNNAEISHHLSAGVIGPEILHIWDQQPIKQKINVLYKSENYYDIIEWERDLSEENSEWQVCNINKII